MPSAPKSVENLTRVMTKEVREAREQAEASLSRQAVQLKMPTCLRGDKPAGKYWRTILKRMKDIELLDDLDSEALGIYCSMLARRDAMDGLYRQIIAESAADGVNAEQRLELLDKADGLLSKMQNHEKTILQYAERLGLTPSGRARLARKRAEAAVEGPDHDLFGD